MNEDFIKQFRKSPSAQMVEKIHMQIERKERIQRVKRYSSLSIGVLLCSFAILLTFSSTVRADVVNFIENVSGFQFDVSSRYPGNPDEEETIIPSEHLSLTAAENRFESPVSLPVHVPGGYELSGDVELFELENQNTLVIQWSHERRGIGIIDLSITHLPSGNMKFIQAVGNGAVEEILLNGKPAVIVRGAWNYDTKQYDLYIMTAIQWKYDENTVYTLSSWNQNLSLDELIQMAESIP